MYRDWFNKYQISLKNPRLPRPPIPGYTASNDSTVAGIQPPNLHSQSAVYESSQPPYSGMLCLKTNGFLMGLFLKKGS